ncbi:tyrosine-protein phosphatase non-receptor type 4 [Macrosteles quadrilineatus]|uniref:tyrosine-protein phosphatase non-receptor type 4 n=2 Tax=Macrosteles quadrilineatus TaxID=74068 RepID=UPI0023E2A371|nr:tyrosine-protein phosphatase non-receptor type 4 [Macrosteles quadrilineatus]
MIESVSRRALGGSSGTYNVRASELARDRLKTLSATVVFLDDTQHCFQLEKRAKGQVLLESVFQHLELIEKDYFGLQFSETGVLPNPPNSDLMRWLDPVKPVKKQLRGNGNLYFCVKFYVSDPSKLQEEYTRYHFYLQIRKDIMTGRLLLPPSTACLLASYTVQSELGDYNPEEHGPRYLSGLQLVPNQTDEMEKKIAELHKLHKGQTPADAEFNFLDHAKRLEMYGVDLHKARDVGGKELQLGVTSMGLVVFQNGVRINIFSWGKIVKISFKRKQFFIQLRREQSENYDTLLGFNVVTYRSCKNLWKSCVEHHTFFRLHSPQTSRGRRFLSLGSKFSYSGRTQCQTLEDSRSSQRTVDRTFIRSPTKRVIRQTVPQPGGLKASGGPSLRPSRPHDHKVTSVGAREPRLAWGEQNTHISDEEGGFLERVDEPHAAFTPGMPARTITYADDETDSDRLFETPLYGEQLPPVQTEEGLVSIRMRPDEQGRFGFNVKGGSDLNMPILVSRVAPNTPADTCYPKLSEGDQVLLINGVDVGHMQHDQVVNLIRAARDSRMGELILTVRPNAVYEADNLEEEPAYQYVPDTDTPHPITLGSDALGQSMLLLADGLASGALLQQFDKLYRKKPGMSTADAKRAENQVKNRYRDISPYDVTRVILAGGSGGDYINANYVNMEIPGSGIINRYIATQGPLSTTVRDFWQMVVEQGSTLVVMVTTLVERGRTKCHKYWPSLSETMELAPGLQLSCGKEEADATGSFVIREFLLRDLQTGEERDVTHMQYLCWPDHGVPDSLGGFLVFVGAVRRCRAGMVEPAIVHCSAGIGRTGVLILAETALCLIEANQPVYPLDIVRQMRDQRAMMIQTPSQYRFVCSCVHHAYTEGLVKPLPEFSSR